MRVWERKISMKKGFVKDLSCKAGNGNPRWSAERERVKKSQKVKGQRHALLYVEDCIVIKTNSDVVWFQKSKKKKKKETCFHCKKKSLKFDWYLPEGASDH